MNCLNVDVRAWVLGEGGTDAAAHVAACDACREEAERLRLTQAALLTLREEEPPRRIAFVSDKVFEPRWWQALLRPGSVMGFVSACVLAAAILAHGAMSRPVAVVQRPVSVAAAPGISEAQVQQRIDSEVAKAVAASEARQKNETARLLAATEQRHELQRKADRVAVEEIVKYYDKQMGRMMVASNQLGDAR